VEYFELLSWLGNFINFTIIALIFTKNFKNVCFDTLDMGLSLYGLGISIFVQMISLVIKKYGVYKK
jgi:hypothetical protein